MILKDTVLPLAGRSASRPCVRGVWLAVLILWGLSCRPLAAAEVGRQLRLEIEPLWRGAVLRLNQELQGAQAAELSISRFDALLSGLALQRLDGTWLESKDWYAFLSAARNRWTASANGVPSGPFKAIRFQIGLPKTIDAGDPNAWPPDHPLHPDLCGLHWGWQGGYVFCAIEGHYRQGSSTNLGFSYHLADASNPMWVTLPVELRGQGPVTVRVAWELSDLLANGAILDEGTSTHSRAGDQLAVSLRQRTARSIQMRSILDDLFQPVPVEGSLAGQRLPASATPYSLGVSERLPRLHLPPDNPLSVEGIELGRRLFHDVRLSGNNRQSCASCHEEARAFAENRAVSVGAEGQVGRRNAMPLFNLAWARSFFWDGRASSLRQQVLMPIQDQQEMNQPLSDLEVELSSDVDYQKFSQTAFGPGALDASRVARALEQFLLTLVAQDSKFDRAARKLAVLTPQEQRGLELFTTEHDPARGLRGADCFHCHGGNLFTNHELMNNGLAENSTDSGREGVTQQIPDRNRFKVPSLRNVALTAPYMHDGRFATLAQVIDHYNGPMARTPSLDPNLAKHPPTGLGLSPEDCAALVAFLQTLTDERFLPTSSASQLSASKSEPGSTYVPTSIPTRPP